MHTMVRTFPLLSFSLSSVPKKKKCWRELCQTGYHNDLWKYDIAAATWTWVSGSSDANQYGCERKEKKRNYHETEPFFPFFLFFRLAGIYGTQGIGTTSTIPGAREFSSTWNGANGKLVLFGGYGFATSTSGELFSFFFRFFFELTLWNEIWIQGYLSDMWEYDTATGIWTWIHGSDEANSPGTMWFCSFPPFCLTWFFPFFRFWQRSMELAEWEQRALLLVPDILLLHGLIWMEITGCLEDTTMVCPLSFVYSFFAISQQVEQEATMTCGSSTPVRTFGPGCMVQTFNGNLVSWKQSKKTTTVVFERCSLFCWPCRSLWNKRCWNDKHCSWCSLFWTIFHFSKWWLLAVRRLWCCKWYIQWWWVYFDELVDFVFDFNWKKSQF